MSTKNKQGISPNEGPRGKKLTEPKQTHAQRPKAKDKKEDAEAHPDKATNADNKITNKDASITNTDSKHGDEIMPM